MNSEKKRKKKDKMRNHSGDCCYGHALKVSLKVKVREQMKERVALIALTTFPMAQSVRWNFSAFICTLSFLEMNASWFLPPMALTSDGVTSWTPSITPPRVLPEGCCADTHRTCHKGRDPHGIRAAPALTGRRRHVVGIHICLSSRSHLFRISTPHTNPC